ncbi:hypothetical protein Bbelb_184170 [Branchiostoma belcheri]|nr:hypothetical protein Bbelb_184170 [Branchiostoma belcheri]
MPYLQETLRYPRLIETAQIRGPLMSPWITTHTTILTPVLALPGCSMVEWRPVSQSPCHVLSDSSVRMKHVPVLPTQVGFASVIKIHQYLLVPGGRTAAKFKSGLTAYMGKYFGQPFCGIKEFSKH